jgi:hypothetical protein
MWSVLVHNAPNCIAGGGRKELRLHHEGTNGKFLPPSSRPVFPHAGDWYPPRGGERHVPDGCKEQGGKGTEWGTLFWICWLASVRRFGSSGFSCRLVPDNTSGRRRAEIFLRRPPREGGTNDRKRERAAAALSREASCPARSWGSGDGCRDGHKLRTVRRSGGSPQGGGQHPKGGGNRGRRLWRGLLLIPVQKLGPVLRGGIGSDVTLYLLPMVYTHYGVKTKEEPRDVCGYHQQFFADYECNYWLGD